MPLPKYILLIFSLLLTFAQIEAQHYSYVNYTKIDGVSSINVYSCTQDKEGFMWFGTDNGLCRYDGQKFYRYTTEDGLPDNDIIEVIADKDGGIWGKTYSQSIFYYYKGIFYTDWETKSNLKKITLIQADKEGGIWAYQDFIPFQEDSFMRAVHIRNLKIQKVIAIKKQDKETKSRIQYIETQASNYLLTVGDTIFAIDAKKLTITQKYPIDNQIRGNKTFYFRFEDLKYEHIYKKEGSSLFIKEVDKNGFDHFKDSIKFTSRIIDIYLHKEKLYVSFEDGGYIITDKYLSNAKKAKRISADIYIGKIFADKEENFWFCTSSGIFFLPPNPINILDKKEQLNISRFNSVFVDKADNIYGGTSLGIIYKKSEKKLDSLCYSKMRQNERILKIVQTDEGRIFYGTDRGMYWIDKKKISFLDARIAVKNFLISKDKKYLYVSGHAKVERYPLVNLTPIANNKKEGEEILIEKGFGLIEDESGGIWIGGRQGLYYYNGKTIENITKKMNAPILQKIQRLALSKDGTLWIATTNKGLIALKDNKIQKIIGKTTYGITDYVCTALFIDEKNDVWLGTKSGLNKISYSYQNGELKYNVLQFSTSKGLTDSEIQDVFVKGNKVYIATNKGICILNDIPFVAKHEIEKAHIWRLQLANKDTNLIDNYVFSYNEKQISIYFSRLCFDCATEPMYEYRLLPAQTNWTTTNEQSVTFNYLNNGNYKFEIRLKDKPTSASSFSFTISTPYWKTRTAFVLYFLLFLGILYGSISLFINSKVQKEREAKNAKHKISELEMRAIKSQMNPHFIFNCIQSIQYYYSVGDSLNANNYISKFAQLIRSTLEISEKPFIPIAEEANYLNTYLMLEEMRFKNLFSYFIEISANIDKDRQMFPALLLQPYVENAIKHGIRNNPKQKGLIFIRFYQKENRLICEVEDNGVGRKRATEIKNRSFLPKHDSKGMKLSHNRIELLNEIGEHINIVLEIIDKYKAEDEAAGTLIRISMPLNFEQKNDVNFDLLPKFKYILVHYYSFIKDLFSSNSKSK